MEPVQFHFDPRCPWCFQASRWIRRLAELGAVRPTWSLYCLELSNLKEGQDPVALGTTARRILEETMVEGDDEAEERSELEQEARLRATGGEPMSPARLALWVGGAFIVAVIIIWIVYEIS